MTVAEALAALRSNFDGRPWHGSPLRTLVSGIDEQQAHAHPMAKARSIAELLAHTVAWIEIVARRVSGEVFEVAHELDFPDVRNVAWSDLVARLDRAHAHLLEAVAALDDTALRAPAAGQEYSVQTMLHGLMHHNTYHAAQIAILKK